MKKTNIFNEKNLDKLIFFLIGISFLLSIKQSFPFNSFDEDGIMNWIKTLDHNQAFPLIYPPLFLYIQLWLSKFYSFILSFLGFINTDSNFLLSDFGYSFTLEAGRILNAIFTSIIVFLTYKIGKMYFNRYVGFFSALLIAVNPLIILYAHIFKPGILTTLLTTATFYFLLKYIKKQHTISIFWASIFCGLSISAKFNVFPLILSIFSAIIIANYEGKKPEFKKLILFIPVGGFIGFFLGAPNWILNTIGNIKAFSSTYSPDRGFIFEQYQTKTMISIWFEFFEDIKVHFGLLILILFILAIIYSIISRNKQNIFIVLFIFFYIIIVSYFGYFADRFSLPMFPVIAILVGKFLFYDIPKVFKMYINNNNKLNLLRRNVLLILLLPILSYAVIQIVYNLKIYNLLKTQSEFNYTVEYREQHNIDDKLHKYNIGRQIYTPRVKGKNIKITKKFQLKFGKRDKKKELHFIQAHLPTYRTLLKGNLYQERKKIDVSRYRPFYIIKKREYQPLNPECIYLYKVAPDLLKIIPETLSSKLDLPKNVLIPRVFYNSNNTSFLPLQVYQQNPNSGITKNGFYSHWIYSKKKINELKFNFISPGATRPSQVTIIVNNIRKTFKIGRKVKNIKLENLKSKKFYFDYIYHIVIKYTKNWKTKLADESYFIFEPIFENNIDDNMPNEFENISLFLSKEPSIPQLFSNEKIPDWIKNYYNQYGVDLTLLQFIGTGHLNLNKDTKTGAQQTDLFPLKKGTYKLLLNWENKNPDAFLLEYVLYTSKGRRTSSMDISKDNHQAILLRTNSETCFIKLAIKPLNNSKIELKQISITPDLNILNIK